jgi:photosystem II stability/assembly factor-like uncharacterized protein
LYAIQILTGVLNLGGNLQFYTYNSCAISDNGNIVVAVGTGGCNVYNGIYVSEDQGSNYSNVQAIEASNVLQTGCCMSSTGQSIFVSDTNYVYETRNFGGSWQTIAPGVNPLGITCSSNGNNVAIFSLEQVFFAQADKGLTFTEIKFESNGIYSLAMSGDGLKLYIGVFALFTTPNIWVGTFLGDDERGDPQWSFTQGAADGPNNRIWEQIVCNSNGAIAYARVHDNYGVYALYKTTDTGVTWSLLSASEVANVGLISCDATGNTLFVESASFSGSIYFSVDGGDTFQPISESFTNSSMPESLTVSRLGGYFAFGQQFVETLQGQVNTGQLRLA